MYGDLEVYGDRFASFLHAPSRPWGLPHLPGITHLECACHEVQRAAVPPTRTSPCSRPSLETNQEHDVRHLVDLREGGDRLVVTRRGPRRAIRRAGAGDFALVEALEIGACVEAACLAFESQADDIVAVVRDNPLRCSFAS